MTTQLSFCLQRQFFDIGDATAWLMQGCTLTVYCLALLVIVTKWVVQVPVAVIIA